MKLLIFLSLLFFTTIYAGYTNDSYVTPYSGQIIKDNNGASFQASRIVFAVKHNITKEQVEKLVAELNGKIVAELKSTGYCRINVPADQREILFNQLKNNPEIINVNYWPVTNHTIYDEGPDYMSVDINGKKILATALSIELQPRHPPEKIMNVIVQYNGSIKECQHFDHDIYSIELSQELRESALLKLKSHSEVFYAIRNYYGKLDEKPTQTDPDGTYGEPYYGKIIPEFEDIKSAMNANRITVGVKEKVTKEQIEQLIKEFSGRISGYSTWPDTSYEIDLPADQREIAIQKLSQIEGVKYVGAQRYSFLDSNGNDLQFSGNQTTNEERLTFFSLIFICIGLFIILYFFIRKYIIKR